MSDTNERQTLLYDRLKNVLTSFSQEYDITLIEMAGVVGLVLRDLYDTISQTDYEDDVEPEQDGTRWPPDNIKPDSY